MANLRLAQFRAQGIAIPPVDPFPIPDIDDLLVPQPDPDPEPPVFCCPEILPPLPDPDPLPPIVIEPPLPGPDPLPPIWETVISLGL